MWNLYWCEVDVRLNQVFLKSGRLTSGWYQVIDQVESLSISGWYQTKCWHYITSTSDWYQMKVVHRSTSISRNMNAIDKHNIHQFETTDNVAKRWEILYSKPIDAHWSYLLNSLFLSSTPHPPPTHPTPNNHPLHPPYLVLLLIEDLKDDYRHIITCDKLGH